MSTDGWDPSCYKVAFDRGVRNANRANDAVKSWDPDRPLFFNVDYWDDAYADGVYSILGKRASFIGMDYDPSTMKLSRRK